MRRIADRKITMTLGQLIRLVRESDEVRLQMVALQKAYDQIKQGKKEATAGSWKLEQLDKDVYWVYFKDAVILEIDYDLESYSYLMDTAALSQEMIDAILETLDGKDFDLEGDDILKKGVVSENAQDWVYIDGVEVTAPNHFGMNKRWKTWFFHTPQEALRFAKNMQDKHDGSSVDVIRHAFDKLRIHTKDPDESWEETIDTINGFMAAKTIMLDLGDLGSIEVPGETDIERLQNKILAFIRNEVG